MKYYGFNPFIQALQDCKRGVIYDLLEGEVFEVTPCVVELFSGNIYKSYKEIMEEALKLNVSEKELKNIILEGKESGIILELSKPYWRNEVVQSKLDIIVQHWTSILILQPTGKCDQNCSFCNSFVNCVCFGKDKEWAEKELKNLFKNLKKFEGKIGRVEIYGGNPLLYSKLDKFLLEIYKLKPRLININIPIFSSPLKVERLLGFRHHYKINFQITFLGFPAYNNIFLSPFIKENKYGAKIKLLFDQNDYDVEQFEEKGDFGFSKEFLLKKDLSNLDWFKEKKRENFLEGVHYFDFFPENIITSVGVIP